MRTVLRAALVLLMFVISVVLVSGQAGKQGGRAMSFSLTSQAFTNGAPIPEKYTCKGADVSPALAWSGAPAQTKAFALIVDDPDAPVGIWVHWVAWNIPASAKSLSESIEKKDKLADGTTQGRSDFGKIGYGGPCPPPGKPHRYFFKLYALDGPLQLKAGATKAELEKAMQGHIVAQTELMGTFKR